MTTDITLKAREGVAVSVRVGQRLRVVNLHGTQVVDLWAVDPSDPDHHVSMEHTRVALSKLVPQVGDHLYSSRRRPMLTVVRDTSPGVHDTLMAACDEERYRLLGAPEGHANCADNYRRALAAVGIEVERVPAPLNVFMNIPWHEDGRLEFLPTVASPGDFVELEAVADVVVVMSACPMDMNPINGYEPADIGVELLAADA
jgi:uncharacterized protein YcgI (DUF1989 family)